jgi:hypothetical protein
LVQQRDGESFIRAKTTFRIGDPKAAKKALDEMQTKSERVRKQIASLIAAGETMEHLRKASSLSSLEECGRQMRKNQAAAKKVSTEAATLDSVVLKVASTDLVSCVSCTQTALTHCTAAKDALNGRLE